MRNYVKEFHEMVDKKQIKVSKKVKKQIKREKRFFKEYDYIPEKANEPIEFLETFVRHYKGELAGQLVVLEPWQKWIIASIHGFHDKNGRRLAKKGVIIVARKNGKTFISAGLCLYHLIATTTGSPEVYTLATQYKQASIAFNDARAFIKNDRELSKIVKSNYNQIQFNYNDGKLEPLASDSSSLDGRNPSFWLEDEKHAWTNADLIEVIESGVGARSEPLGLSVTTSGHIRGSVYDEEYNYVDNVLSDIITDDHTSAFVFEMDSADEIHEPSNWVKANPNLGVSVFEEYLHQRYKKAENDPIKRVGIYTKNFNLPMTQQEIFFSNDEINFDGYDESRLYGKTAFVGLDMSYTTDITVLTFYVKTDKEILIKQFYIIPEGQLHNRLVEDKIDYKYYEELGEVIILKGETINQIDVYNIMMDKIKHYNFAVPKFGIDPYRADYILSELRNVYGEDSAKAVNNSYRKAITPTIYRLKKDLKNKTLKSNSKLLQINLAGCVAEINNNDEILLVKKQQRHRIDGAYSLLYGKKAYELYLLDNGINASFDYEDEQEGGE